jgi:hypothetical protein
VDTTQSRQIGVTCLHLRYELGRGNLPSDFFDWGILGLRLSRFSHRNIVGSNRGSSSPERCSTTFAPTLIRIRREFKSKRKIVGACI